MGWLKPTSPVGGDASPLALALLCVHSATLLLLCRYSLGTIGEAYSLPVLVMIIEMWKLGLTFAWLWISGASIQDLVLSIWTSRSPRWCLSGAFVAVLALFQFLAVKHLPALTFAVGVNLRLVFVLIFGAIFPPTTTAASALMSPVSSFSTTTGITARKARWSLMLILGLVILWHDPPLEAGGVDFLTPAHFPAESSLFARSNRLGYLALLLLAVLDGFARVYLDRTHHSESSLRRSGVVVAAPSPNGGGPNLWERNLRLSFWGIVMSVVLLVVTDWSLVRSTFFGSAPSVDSDPSVLDATPRRLLSGFSLWSTGIVLLQSLGSLVLAYAVRRTSEKGVALVSVWSVILVGVGSYFLLQLRCTAEALCGAGVVCVAMWSWSDEELPQNQGERLPTMGDLAENTALFAGHANGRSADADFTLQELGRDGLDRSYDSPHRQPNAASHQFIQPLPHESDVDLSLDEGDEPNSTSSNKARTFRFTPQHQVSAQPATDSAATSMFNPFRINSQR
jgi:hypothetical protein